MKNQSHGINVKERAKLFEHCSRETKKGFSSLSEIGNNPGSDGTNAEGHENILEEKNEAPERPHPPPVLPKPKVNLADVLGGSPPYDERHSLVTSEGSENLSQVVSSAASSSGVTSDHSEPYVSNMGGDTLVSSTSSEESSGHYSKIEKVVEELVSTEHTYLSILELLINKFPSAMTNLQNGEPHLDTITEVLRIDFLKPIYQFHADHLYPEFKNRLDNWKSDPRISDIILSRVKFFKVYTQFVVDQDDCILELERLTNFFPDFKRAVEAFRVKILKEPEYESIKGRMAFRFSELLRAPFNRLFHYRNLLDRYSKELEKQSYSEQNTEINGAKQAIAEMSCVIEDLNVQMKKRAESIKFQQQLSSLRSKIPEIPDFFKNKELILVREGQLFKQSRKVDQSRYVVLFDTHLVIAKPNQFGVGGYSINHTFDLVNTKASVDARDPKCFTVSVPLPNSSSTFRTSSPTECDQWVQDIEDTRNRLGSKSNDELMRLPPWKPDHMFTNCTLCAIRFTTIVRRHHCRLCGLVYCESCSSQKWALIGSFFRVCDICYAVQSIDACPSAELPVNLLEKIGSRSVWDQKTSSEKWSLYKDEMFARDHNGTVPYLREIIASSLTCAKSGYLYLLDSKSTPKFLTRWIVLELDCLVIFEACQNTIALERRFLAGFRFEGPFSIEKYPDLKQAAENVSVKFVFSCWHENYNSLVESSQTPCLAGNTLSPPTSIRGSSRRSISHTLSRMLTSPSSNISNCGSAAHLNYLFGVEKDYIAEDWVKELQQLKRHSELITPGSTASSVFSDQ